MLRRAAELPGNPYDVEVHERSGMVATRVGQLPHLPWYWVGVKATEKSMTHKKR